MIVKIKSDKTTNRYTLTYPGSSRRETEHTYPDITPWTDIPWTDIPWTKNSLPKEYCSWGLQLQRTYYFDFVCYFLKLYFVSNVNVLLEKALKLLIYSTNTNSLRALLVFNFWRTWTDASILSALPTRPRVLQLVPLSERICVIWPLLLMNCLRALMQESVSKECAISKWTALLDIQVNMTQ